MNVCRFTYYRTIKKMKTMKIRSILCMILFVCATALGHARDITGRIVGPDNRPVADATVIASVNDSVVSMQLSDVNGLITIHYEGAEAVDVEVQAIGFENKGVRVESDSTSFTVQLKKAEKSTDLKEVTVEADRSETMKRLANGNRFYLSSKARAKKNPFMALKEIPMLITDPIEGSVTTLKKESPLILINGVELNSGIRPISPADIEYVEVIDVVPARYLARGVTAIVNIKLRDHRPPYVWTQLLTKHELPIRMGRGAGYFEVGNEKFSLYGMTFMDYTHHNDSEGSVQQSNMGSGPDYAGYTRNYEWNNRNNFYSYRGELLFKYVPTSKDYLALRFSESNSKSFSKTTGHGVFETGEVNEYTKYSGDKNRSSVFTTSAYYKHTFTSTSDIVVTADYNNNHNRLVTDGYEHFGDKPFNMNTLFQNRRNSGNISIDYTKSFKDGSAMMFGSRTSLRKDRIRQQPQSTFNYNNYSTLVYGTYAGQVKKLNYMGSIGMTPQWIKGDNISYHCINPYASASLTCQLNKYHSLRTSYSLSSGTPEARHLSPYNTSTDSLIVTRGNPDLVPQKNHSLTIDYNFYKKKFFFQVMSYAILNTDLISACGFTDEKGVYTSTYENKGKFRSLNTAVYLGYTVGNDNYNGNISLGVTHHRLLYDGHSPKDNYDLYCNITGWLKKFFVNAMVQYTPKSYSDISTTRNLRPFVAKIQASYNITENLSVSAGLEGFAGDIKTKVMTNDGTFKSVSLTKLTDSGFHPWITVIWNMRKNTKRKIKLGNVLNSNESGINLK